MRMLSRVLAFLLTVAAVTGPLAGPAAAADASITFTATGTNGAAETHAACQFTVSDGADGLGVLQTAVDQGCIDSYAADTQTSGTFVTEIDAVEDGPGVVGVNCFFWVYFVNGVPADTGVDGYSAEDGDVISWALEPFGSPLVGFC